MEDMKILKEAHQKKEQPELQPEELLNRKLSGMPSAEEATMVTWEELEQAITDGWKGSQTVNKDLRVINRTSAAQKTGFHNIK
ncbi:hypothetical protein Celaphus_00001601 [Cervus elaphus hippelaphus]|uniref:Uncharacterized protein n=1 Tax=Cervus elaphus hippelaphus TaxID=46360 RepID=A0A212D8P7_CEREH|nr:hypothetical protein Celaphus_00001601 [Cervus elaphus hippelaphus]